MNCQKKSLDELMTYYGEICICYAHGTTDRTKMLEAKAKLIEEIKNFQQTELNQKEFIKCPRRYCPGEMKNGADKIAIKQTYTCSPDFIGDRPEDGCTVSNGGPGEVVPVWKCNQCGHSFTA